MRFAETVDRHLLLVLGVISLVAWVTFGAVTWVDARTYIDIARELRSLEDFHNYHAGSRIWYHNYVPLALPYMWLILERLPIELIWPVVALSNRIIALLALVYFVRSLQTVHRSPWFSIAALILALHPFYQGFQNAYVTESMSGALLLFGLGLTIRALNNRAGSRWLEWALTLLAIAIFFRVNVALMILCCIYAVLLSSGSFLSRRSFYPALVFAVAFYAQPLAISLLKGELALPRIGLSSIVEGIRINPEPSAQAIQKVEVALGADEAAILLKAGADWGAALKYAEKKVGEGMSNDDLLDAVERAGRALRADSWAVEMRAWLIAGGAVGLPLDCRFAASDYLSMRDLPAKEYCRLYYSWYRGHGWIGDTLSMHQRWMKDFFSVEGRGDLALYQDAWDRYVNNVPSIVRDPLSLIRIPFDLFVVGFLIAVGMLLFRRPFLAVILLGILIGNWIIYASVPFGGVRYAYPLFPIYLLILPLAYLCWTRDPYRSPVQCLLDIIQKNFSRGRSENLSARGSL